MNDKHKTKAQLRDELAAARQRIAALERALGLRALPAGDPSDRASPGLVAAFSEALANSLPGILYLFDAQAQLLWWNQELERVTGYRPEELAATPIAQLVPGESLPLVRQRFQAAMETGSAEVEVALVARDGRHVPYSCTAHRMEFAGDPCVVGMGIEVSERQRAERRRLVRLTVPQLLAQAATLADAAPEVLQVIAEGLGWDLGVLWLADAPAQVLRCLEVWQAPSVQTTEFIETSRKQCFEPGVGLPGRVWRTGQPAWVTDVAADKNFPRCPSAQAEGLHGAFAYPIAVGRDVLGVIEFFSRAVREPDADLLEMMSTVGGQIGQFLRRKEAEAGLRRSEARKAAMLAAALDAIITIDHEERILEFNPAAERIFGYPRASVLGRRLSELIIPPAYRAEHRRGMRHYLASGEGPVLGRRVEMPALRAGGSEFPAEISIVPTVLDGRPIFTGYVRDITERKRAEQDILQFNRALEQRVADRTAELESANAQLARAAELKDEFFATVSHELRTPLGGVIGMVELLAEAALDEKQRHYAHIAHTSAGLLRDVINDILDFSRIEAGQFHLERMDFNPAEVVHEVVSILSPQAADKGLGLHCRLDRGVDAWLSGDRGRLRQVLVNLVANAVKFTERGTVIVRVSVERGGVARPEGPDRSTPLRFAVNDSGIGIPHDRRDRLFQPFSQVDASTSRRYGGSGLGLAICRRLTELMGGTIGVESELGRGSTFWFTVPLNPAQAPRPAAGSEPAGAPGVGTPARPLRILLAEDNAANQVVATALLESAGHSVRVVPDGRQALAAHAEERFDLILMDVQMPEVDGLEATREIRCREAGRQTHTPIVAVTAHAGKGDRDRFLAAGMDGCLTKPLARRELAGVLEALVPSGPPRISLPPAPPAPEGGDAIDWAAVLARLEGNEALLAEVIDLYVREWPRLFAELRQALDRGDLGIAAFKAHRLNGLTRNFGGPAAAAAANLETLANQGEGAAVRRAMDQLKAACVQLEREVGERRRGDENGENGVSSFMPGQEKGTS
jgi:PAS domain S-box-containing protein